MSEKSMIIPAIFDDCEAIQIVNGVPALVIQDKDGEDDFFGVIDEDEFIRRTGISKRVLKDLSVLLGMPLYWRNSAYEEDPERGYQFNPTIFSSYQPLNNRILANGVAFSTSGSVFGPRRFVISLDYAAPSDDDQKGVVVLTAFEE